jgi:hypothetical protein
MSDRIKCQRNKLSCGPSQFCVLSGNSIAIANSAIEADSIFLENTFMNPVSNVPVKKLLKQKSKELRLKLRKMKERMK